jgi:heme A synthase
MMSGFVPEAQPATTPSLADPAPALRRFRRLSGVAVAATFLLIVVGGVVRISDSGLGCGAAGSGARGWPLCGGRVVPFIQTNSVIEYTHRLLATVVVVLLVALAWQSIRHLRGHRFLVRGSVVAVALVLFQAVLGGLTVEHNLRSALVAAHLGTAMLLLAVLIALAWAAPTGGLRASVPERGGVVRAAAVAACTLLLATIVAGGVIAGTERHGTAGHHESEGAHLACGKQFPTCNGAFLPYGAKKMVDIQLAHRTLMFAAVLAIAGFLALARRRRVRSRRHALVVALLAAQVLLGALNVWLGEHGELVVAHLAVATLLWATLVAATLALMRVPEPAAEAIRTARLTASGPAGG